jgi:hypothetical protein
MGNRWKTWPRLHDLQIEPEEFHNLANSPDHSDVVGGDEETSSEKTGAVEGFRRQARGKRLLTEQDSGLVPVKLWVPESVASDHRPVVAGIEFKSP